TEEEAVEVEAVVATGIVARRPCVAAAVPGRAHVLEGAWRMCFEALEEGWVDRAAVARQPPLADAECMLEEALLLVHGLDQVGDALGVELARSNVYMDSGSFVGAGACGANRADDLLQQLDIIISEDRRDDFSAVLAAAQRAVAYDAPGAAL